MTRESALPRALYKAGPLLTSHTSPQPMMPQRSVMPPLVSRAGRARSLGARSAPELLDPVGDAVDLLVGDQERADRHGPSAGQLGGIFTVDLGQDQAVLRLDRIDDQPALG